MRGGRLAVALAVSCTVMIPGAPIHGRADDAALLTQLSCVRVKAVTLRERVVDESRVLDAVVGAIKTKMPALRMDARCDALIVAATFFDAKKGGPSGFHGFIALTVLRLAYIADTGFRGPVQVWNDYTPFILPVSGGDAELLRGFAGAVSDLAVDYRQAGN